MKLRKGLKDVTNRKRESGKKAAPKNELVHNFMVMTGCASLAVVIAVGSKFVENGERSQVFAAAEPENAQAVSLEYAGFAEDYLPTGIAGVVTGVAETPFAGSSVKRIGTSCEKVMVGQRIKKVEGSADDLNIRTSMADTVESFGTQAVAMAENPKLMSDTDYDTLLRIVEAEAGTEDVKGRVLVANVIMNRVKHEEFPDSVTDVVWDYSFGVPQFSPTYDGSIGRVSVTEDTREAVRQALEGVDYSEGALFFIQRSAAEKHNVTWFDKDLKKLFKYGVHEFYTYPDENDKKEASGKEESEAPEADDTVVQMVKNDIFG